MTKTTDAEILTAIVTLTKTNGYPPSLRELALEVGLDSSSSIKSRLDMLKNDGLISSVPNQPRTLKVTI